jgi:serine protease Do
MNSAKIICTLALLSVGAAAWGQSLPAGEAPQRPASRPSAASQPAGPIVLVSSAPQRLVLKDGSEIFARIIKNDGRNVAVDFGFDVMQFPLAEVAKIVGRVEASSQPTSAPGKVLETSSSTWQLYRTAKLEPASIEQNARICGEAVVMVNCPGGQGSGFVISPDGYLITNYHVVSGETKVKVTIFQYTDKGYEQKSFKKVHIIALNPFVDLALLKIDEPQRTFSYVYLGDSRELEAGQDVFAIGNPLGLTRTVSQGIVSTKNRNFEGQLYIQTTTDINPGNSGGPLFNNKGEVIGVTSMGYLFLGGLNFAIPVDVVKRFIENRDAFAYDEDNPNTGQRYLQPDARQNRSAPPRGRLPDVDSSLAAG